MKKLFEKLGHNTGLKLVALFFAILAWSFVISAEDPYRSRTIKDVPITVTGLDELESRGLIVRKMNEVLKEADVVVDVKVSEASRLNPTVINLTADVSSITSVGETTVFLNESTSIGVITEVKPRTIAIDVQERITRNIPISIEYTGTLDGSLYHREPTLSRRSVEITGARSDVELVTSAVCEIDLTNVQESVNSSFSLELRDKAGEVVDSKLFTSVMPVEVQMEILGQKTLSIATDPKLCVTDPNDVAEGFVLGGISFSPQTVTLIGDKATLEKIETVGIELVKLNGIGETKTFDVKLSLPKNVELLAQTPIQMTAQIVVDPLAMPTPLMQTPIP